MARAWLVALIASLSVALPGIAVNPLDNDAGSGGDAGDVPELAQAISPGFFAGRLSRPHDLWDYFVFEGRAGQLVQAEVQGPPGTYLGVHDAHGAQLGSAGPGEPLEVLLTSDGDWYIVLATGFVVLDPSFAVLDYVVAFHLAKPAYAAWTASSGQTIALEAGWDRASPMRLAMAASVPFAPDEPRSAMVAIEWSSVLHGYGYEIHVIPFAESGATSGSGTGNGLAIHPILSTGPLLKVRDLDPPSEVFRGWFSFTFTLPDAIWVRIATASTIELDMSVGIHSDAPFEAAFGHDVASFVWDETNSGAAVQVLAPGISVTGSRSWSGTLGPRTVAFADAGWWPATLTGPGGEVYELDIFRPRAFVVFPEHGAWTMEVGPTVGLGPGAVHRYLHVVEMPALGIAPTRA